MSQTELYLDLNLERLEFPLRDSQGGCQSRCFSVLSFRQSSIRMKKQTTHAACLAF